MAKQYTLDDGSITTALQVAARVGVSVNNARTRLSLHTDPLKVFKPKQSNIKSNADSYKMRRIDLKTF